MTVRVVTTAPEPAMPDVEPAVTPERAQPPAPKERVAAAAPATQRAKIRPVRSLAGAQTMPIQEAPASDAAATVVAPGAKLDTPPAADTAPPIADSTLPQLPSPPASDASDRELPVYRTQIPPALSVRYAMRRGALRGTGELLWNPEGDRYEARLVGRLAGIIVLTQISQGGFDEAGVAPMRFTDQRAAGAVRAANFQREVGKITFSGPPVEHTLLVGSQDRLTWMIQLAAVVTAEPRRLTEGGKVVIHVVGARGDSRLWVFRCTGVETITVGAEAIETVRFVRDVSEPYDTRVEVWLDPRRHHLPARALLRSGADDDGLELVAQEPAAAP